MNLLQSKIRFMALQRATALAGQTLDDTADHHQPGSDAGLRRMSPGDTAMLTKLRYGTALLALACLAHLPMTQSAMAITVELARKCGALTDKAYPLRVPGNPAAGREHGTAKEVRDYFNKCVANRGNVGEQPLEPGNHTQTPSEGSDKGGQAPQQRRSFPDGLL
jgi:hypothetical protein